MRKEKRKKKEMLAKKDKFSDRMVNYTCNRKKQRVFINCRNSKREKERSNQWIFRQYNKMKE